MSRHPNINSKKIQKMASLKQTLNLFEHNATNGTSFESFLLGDLLKLQLRIQMHADFIKIINWYGLCVATQAPTTSKFMEYIID